MNPVPVLLMESDPNDVFLLERAFRKSKIPLPLLSVPDGEGVIEYLTHTGKFADAARFPAPCVLILDLKTEGKGGLEVLAWMKEHPEFRVTPAVVWSGTANKEDVEAAYDLGANSVLVKPLNHERLCEMVSALFEYWSRCCVVVPAELASENLAFARLAKNSAF